MNNSGQHAVNTGSTRLEDGSTIDELSGSLASRPDEKRLMRSVLDNDEDTITDGKLITAALNSGISAFTPDLLFDKLVTNYQLAKKIYGESFLHEASGYSESEVERNAHIPEFRRELRQRLLKREEEMKQQGFIDRDGRITGKGITLSTLLLVTEELDKLVARGLLGEKNQQQEDPQGVREEAVPYQRGKYRDLAVRRSVMLAARRGHSTLEKHDLMRYERSSKGKRSIIYALDASGSMKGQKLGSCKKAGIALAYKAISEKDSVGLIVFGKDVKTKVAPTQDFARILQEITSIHARERTNLAATIREGIALFPKDESTKHLLLITDALPTAGDKPERETLEAVALAAGRNITVSVAGIGMQEDGKALAEHIAEIGKGRIFVVKNPEDIDMVVLEDYQAVSFSRL